MSDNVEALIAEARKASDEIHRWAFGADDEIPDDRHEVRLRVEAITDALTALESRVVPSDTDREALREAIMSVPMQGTRAKAYEIADAILAAGFRRSPEPQQVGTVAELDALPVGSVVLDPFAAVCVRASDTAGALDWRRVTSAVRGGEHLHMPYLPATVLWVPDTEGSESGE